MGEERQFGQVASKALAHRPASLANNSQRVSPAAVSQIIAHLTGCLALVRPAGMPDAEANDWLAAAAKALAAFPVHDVAIGCLKAQRECTHYSQIVASVAKHCQAAKIPEPIKWDGVVAALPPPKLTQADVDRIVSERGRELSIMRDRGLIHKTDDGRFVPA